MEIMKLEFEDEIKELERKILDHPNKEDLIVFYGSSSFRLWSTMEEDLHPLNILNLGFGGSSYGWCVFYFDRLFARIRPKKILLYAGDNDLYNGIETKKVLKNFLMLNRLIRISFPEIPVVVLTVKPSPERTFLLPEIRSFNDMIYQEQPNLNQVSIINVFDAMMNEYGSGVNHELFGEDNLHMNEKGYALWASLIKSHLS